MGSPPKYLEDPRCRGKSGKDFSHFMRDKRGSKVMTYYFEHRLLEGKSGQPLEIPRQFTSKGVLQFQSGAVAFDDKIRGGAFNVLPRAQ
ncbi:MAG TPA: hypothetical protein VJ953_18260 [Saprospiraceae bacterium]|nr:hypothetical protein [Saprospiraceae bacterium]